MGPNSTLTEKMPSLGRSRNGGVCVGCMSARRRCARAARGAAHQLSAHNRKRASGAQLQLAGAVRVNLNAAAGGGQGLARRSTALAAACRLLTSNFGGRLSKGRRPSTRCSSSSACQDRSAQQAAREGVPLLQVPCCCCERAFTMNSRSLSDRMASRMVHREATEPRCAG